MRGLIASAIAVLFFAALGAVVALANTNTSPYNGNPLDWCDPTSHSGQCLGLRQSRIGSLNVPGKLTYVCSIPEFANSTALAIWYWNSDLSAANSNYTVDPQFAAFTWRGAGGTACDWADAKVTWDYFTNLCPKDQDTNRYPHACTYSDPSGRNWVPPYYSVGYVTIDLNPYGHEDLAGNYTPWSDGDFHTTRDIAHELGHSFGAGEYNGCPYGIATVMDTTESCLYLPSTLDAWNYYQLYHPPAVQNLSASQPSPGTVVLTWDQTIPGDGRDIPNEKDFAVELADGTILGKVDKNQTQITLTGRPKGATEVYNVISESDADNSIYRDYASKTVHIDPPAPTDTPMPTSRPTATFTSGPTATSGPTPTATATPYVPYVGGVAEPPETLPLHNAAGPSPNAAMLAVVVGGAFLVIGGGRWWSGKRQARQRR